MNFWQKLNPFRKRPLRVGWISYDSFPDLKTRFDQLIDFTRIRGAYVPEWINAHAEGYVNEVYRPSRRYDVVLFIKMMDARCQQEALRIRAYGGKFLFDANVNYWEIWGDYFVPGTRPTEEQQRDAIWMTRNADWVVADSSYIAGIARKFSDRVTWIPDCVNLDVFSGVREHGPAAPVRLVWSGVGKKAAHLLLVRDALARLRGATLTLVSDVEPAGFAELNAAIPCSFVKYSNEAYADVLRRSDIIISPKITCNGYEMGHTEYKITLGMAMGLPAVASPQQSYREAVGHRGGGFIAESVDEWAACLEKLVRDHALRADLGRRARETVLEKYTIPVVARQYLELLDSLTGRKPAP